MSASSVLWVWYSVVQFSQIPMHASDTGIWDVRIPGRSSILRWDVHHGMHSRTLAPDMSSISATGQGLRVDPSTVYLFRTSKDPKRSVEVLHVKSARKTWDHEGDRIHRHYCTLTNPEIDFFLASLIQGSNSKCWSWIRYLLSQLGSITVRCHRNGCSVRINDFTQTPPARDI